VQEAIKYVIVNNYFEHINRVNWLIIVHHARLFELGFYVYEEMFVPNILSDLFNYAFNC
jgi:hypothetical protein